MMNAPKSVRLFEGLMYISLGIGVIISILRNKEHLAIASEPLIITVQVFTLAVMVLFIWLIARRRKNWARWTFLCLFILGTPSYIPFITNSIHQNISVSTILSLIQLVFQLTATYFVFSPESRAWFKPS